MYFISYEVARIPVKTLSSKDVSSSGGSGDLEGMGLDFETGHLWQRGPLRRIDAPWLGFFRRPLRSVVLLSEGLEAGEC